jgi:hypothetical protein
MRGTRANKWTPDFCCSPAPYGRDQRPLMDEKGRRRRPPSLGAHGRGRARCRARGQSRGSHRARGRGWLFWTRDLCGTEVMQKEAAAAAGCCPAIPRDSPPPWSWRTRRWSSISSSPLELAPPRGEHRR